MVSSLVSMENTNIRAAARSAPLRGRKPVERREGGGVPRSGRRSWRRGGGEGAPCERWSVSTHRRETNLQWGEGGGRGRRFAGGKEKEKKDKKKVVEQRRSF